MRLLFPGAEHGPVDLENGRYVLGSGDGVQIALHAAGIAQKHCDLQVNGELGVVTPIGIDTTVSVNGTRIARSTDFRAGDLIAVADVKIRVVAIDKAATTPGVQIVQKRHHDADPDDGRTRIRQALPKYLLRGLAGATFGKVFPLTGVTVIGRAAECDIAIPNDEISRRHAELRVSQDGVMIEDLGSANGTYVNDKRVTRELLKHGDEIRIDQLRFQIVAPGKEMLQSQIGAPGPGGAPPPAPRPDSLQPASSAGISAVAWILVLVIALVLLIAAMKFAGAF
jgi:pSer/pThr/pTyr-binding forkhead associated (FHA) protein